LKSEIGLGVDLSMRWQTRRASGEVSWYRNAIDRYIFRNPLTPEEIEAEYGPDLGAEFPVIRFTPTDAVLTGMELHSDVRVMNGLTAEGGLDLVRGTNRELDQPLPRIPPFRIIAGLRYQRNALQFGGTLIVAAKQDRVFGAETPTDGYTTLRLFSAYLWQTGENLHSLTLRVDNVTNELYFNHLSYLKDVVPEMGRSVKLVYGVRF
jgi:iron complex outermembrane receptor protein